jgi:hypothetical protein
MQLPARAAALWAVGALLLQGASGQQCAVVVEEADELYGTPGCPCLREDTADGYKSRGPDRPNVFNVSLNGDGQGAFTDGVERDYGHLCGTHDWGSAHWCLNMSDPATAASWCSDSWCWVDPNNCDGSTSQTTYFPNWNAHYSYHACNGVDKYTSDDVVAAAYTGTRQKLKAVSSPSA